MEGTAERTNLYADIDSRLTEQIALAMCAEEWTWELVVKHIRAAYAAGHKDALEDPTPERLYAKHGYTTPRRRR